MRTISKLAVIINAMLLLSACASTAIFPEGQDKYLLVTTARDQGDAEKAAVNKASERCESAGKKLVVTSHRTHYHGDDESIAEVKMKFRCK